MFHVIRIDIEHEHEMWHAQPHAYDSDTDVMAKEWGEATVYDTVNEAVSAARTLANGVVFLCEAVRAEVWLDTKDGGRMVYEVSVEVTDRDRWSEIARLAGDTEVGRYYAEQVRVVEPRS